MLVPLQGMTEQWLPITGHSGYEISNKGRVRSFNQPNRPGRILKHGRGGKGHHFVTLYPAKKSKSVHILVLEEFVGPRPPGMLGLHRDGNVDNNHVENLYWGTHSDNAHDAVRHGTHNRAKRTECKRGHPIDGVRRNADGSVRQRYCKTCNREQVREWKKAHRVEKHPMLTEEQIDLIRKDSRPLRVVAADYGVSHTTVRRIRISRGGI